MKIIFLDIDGVLNHRLHFERRNAKRKLEGDNGLSNIKSPQDFFNEEIDIDSVKLLNNLIEKTGAKIVISSTWRILHTISELTEILKNRGFKGEIIGVTPRSGCSSCLRGNEIYQWIKQNEDTIGESYYKYNSYVILDDDSDMLYWQRNNFLLVDNYCGLTPNIIYKAEKILNGEF